MQAFHIVGPAPLYTNTFLLISDDGQGVVIDPAADAAEYNKILEENGAKLTDILCTHGHYDHVGSAMELRSRWGAKLWCEADDLAGNELFPLTEADMGYPEGDTITAGGLEFTVWHTPGHTKGSVCLLCDSWLFAGDTLFQGSTGRTDFPGGSPVEMRASLLKLAGLPIPREAQLLPGHGDFSTFGWELDHNWYIKNARRQGRG